MISTYYSAILSSGNVSSPNLSTPETQMLWQEGSCDKTHLPGPLLVILPARWPLRPATKLTWTWQTIWGYLRQGMWTQNWCYIFRLLLFFFFFFDSIVVFILPLAILRHHLHLGAPSGTLLLYNGQHSLPDSRLRPWNSVSGWLSRDVSKTFVM